jgi:hypothetical protein
VSVCVPPIGARQRLSKHVPAAKNTHASIEELLDLSFSMRCMSYQRKVISTFQNFLLVIISLVKAGSNTSTVALRVVRGDAKGTQCLGI